MGAVVASYFLFCFLLGVLTSVVSDRDELRRDMEERPARHEASEPPIGTIPVRR